MMRRFLIYLAVAVCAVSSAQGQVKGGYFISPVDFPVSLSGNFGEVRSNHFHGGIDIRTEGVTGKPVHAMADGYVSRISVSPSGYGTALYVAHPNGTTTVFGHLERFNDPIQAYVRERQHAGRSFSIDLYPERWQFPVKQGDLIAYSGNSGSSGGPHIHLEIRDPQGRPTNILTYQDFGVTDNIAPRFFNLYQIGVDTIKGVPVHSLIKKYALRSAGKSYVISSGETVRIDRPTYFAVEIIDHKTNSQNIFGTYAMEQFVNGQQNFGYRLDNAAFDDNRYINSFTYYPINRGQRYEVIRTYVAPGNAMSIYNNVKNRGIVNFLDDSTHTVEIVIADEYTNRASLRFDAVRSDKRVPKKMDYALSDSTGVAVRYDRPFSYSADGVSVDIPSGSIYESMLLDIRPAETVVNGEFSRRYAIGRESFTPLHKYMTISIQVDSVPAHLREKLCIASIDRNRNRIYEGGTLKRDKISVATRSFGTYYVTADTIPPRIVPRFAAGADLRHAQKMSLIMTDDFSGIKEWEVKIDGVWTLFEYDAKNNTITHDFSDARYPTGKIHSVEARAVDYRGNERVVVTTFLR